MRRLAKKLLSLNIEDGSDYDDDIYIRLISIIIIFLLKIIIKMVILYLKLVVKNSTFFFLFQPSEEGPAPKRRRLFSFPPVQSNLNSSSLPPPLLSPSVQSDSRHNHTQVDQEHHPLERGYILIALPDLIRSHVSSIDRYNECLGLLLFPIFFPSLSLSLSLAALIEK